MDHISGIIQQRAAPGVLVFDGGGGLQFANPRALELLELLRAPGDGPEAVPEAIQALCRQVREGGTPTAALHPQGPAPDGAPGLPAPCSLRALPLGAPGSGAPATHVMVLMERIVEKHRIDLDKARGTFQLSRREAEVLNLVEQGLSNRKIAELLYLSEHTVKDHLKSLMKKLGAGSRGEVVAALR